MNIKQSTLPIEDGYIALAETLYGERAPTLRNIKCFVGPGLSTASDLAHAASAMIDSRRNGVVRCEHGFYEEERDHRTAADLIASL